MPATPHPSDSVGRDHVEQQADLALIDPDVDHYSGVPGRPLHFRFRYLYVVFLGGMLGTLARWAVSDYLDVTQGIPWGTLAANLSGALLLGVLISYLAQQPDHGWQRLARLHFGTGFLGSFTTYSALAVSSHLLARDDMTVGLAYLVGSALAGVLMAAIGTLLGDRVSQRRTS